MLILISHRQGCFYRHATPASRSLGSAAEPERKELDARVGVARRRVADEDLPALPIVVHGRVATLDAMGRVTDREELEVLHEAPLDA